VDKIVDVFVGAELQKLATGITWL